MAVYTSFLPLAMWASAGWMTFFVAPTIAFLLIAIESVGAHMEGAVTVLPLMKYCEAVHGQIIALTHDWRAEPGAQVCPISGQNWGAPSISDRQLQGLRSS